MAQTLRFHYNPETLVFTVKGEDLYMISQICAEINLQNKRRSFKPRNSYLRPFLPEADAMRRTKDLNGVGTLTVQCTSQTSYCDVFIYVSEAFYVTCDPGQEDVGTIVGKRPNTDPMASALVSTYIWPIVDDSHEIASSEEAVELSTLGI
jgi:hypothetical protein